MLGGFCLYKIKIEGLQVKTFQRKTWTTTSIALFECVWRDLFRQTDRHTQTLESSSFSPMSPFWRCLIWPTAVRETHKNANEREGTWTKRIGKKHIGKKRIGDKTYWQQNISATKLIGDKTYRRQIVSGTKCIGNKRYCPIADKTYRGQNVSAD